MPIKSHEAQNMLTSEELAIPLPGCDDVDTAVAVDTLTLSEGGGNTPTSVPMQIAAVVPSRPLPSPNADDASGSPRASRLNLPALSVAWTWTGDPTEAALLAVGMKSGLNLRTLHQMSFSCPRIDTVPFSSDIKFMATLHDVHVPMALTSGAPTSTDLEIRRIALVKGSADTLLPRCSSQAAGLNPWVPEPLQLDHWLHACTQLSHEGLRVLALCHAEFPSSTQLISSDMLLEGPPILRFHCLIGIIDPPRSEATDAIAVCHSAGVQVCMVTGDHAETARTISRWMGIPNNNVITGTEMQDMTDAELFESVRGCFVYARATPEHKLRIVKALQRYNNVVAMTGDGVNDAPALKAANVGVAMGISGSEVAKEAAKLILLDDNFASIVPAIRYGRAVYENIMKQLCFLLPTSIAQGLSIAVAIAIGVDHPLTAIQVLWINMITAATLGLVIGLEQPEAGVMLLKPRCADKWLVGRYIIWRAVYVGAAMICVVLGNAEWTLALGGTSAQAHTVALNSLVVVQSLYCLSCRHQFKSSLSVKAVTENPWLTAMILLNTGLQCLITYTPALHDMFDTVSISGYDWLRVIGLAFALFLFVELEKAFGAKYLDPHVTPFISLIQRVLCSHCRAPEHGPPPTLVYRMLPS